MFWISAMGFNIWRLFTGNSERAYRCSSQHDARGELRTLLLFCVYGQGMPLIVSIITAIIDSTRPLINDGSRRKISPMYPNMGDLGCFLGESEPMNLHYLESARFLYSDLFVILIQITNFYFFSTICLVLYRGWENQKKILQMKR